MPSTFQTQFSTRIPILNSISAHSAILRPFSGDFASLLYTVCAIGNRIAPTNNVYLLTLLLLSITAYTDSSY